MCEKANRKTSALSGTVEGFAGYRPAGRPICLCLQMAKAAAIKGQQNVSETRPYSDCNHVPVTKGRWGRGGDTPRWNDTHALSLVPARHPHNVSGAGPQCSWWAFPSLSSSPQIYTKLPPHRGNRSGCALPSSSQTHHQGLFEVPSFICSSFTHLHHRPPPSVTQPG